jgi:hypothetical protein
MRKHNLFQLNRIFLRNYLWWLHSKVSLWKMASKSETVSQCGLKKFSFDDDKSNSIQQLMLVTPEWIRHSVVHSQDLRHQSNVGCSFVKDLVQVSVIMWIKSTKLMQLKSEFLSTYNYCRSIYTKMKIFLIWMNTTSDARVEMLSMNGILPLTILCTNLIAVMMNLKWA